MVSVHCTELSQYSHRLHRTMANLFKFSILLFTLSLHASWAQEGGPTLSECELSNLVAIALDPSATPQPCNSSSSSTSTTERTASSPTPTSTLSSPTPPPLTPGRPVPTSPPPSPSPSTPSGPDLPQCTSVTYSFCSGNVGEGVIPIKNELNSPSKGSCSHYMVDPHFPKDNWTCGVYNPKGLGFKTVSPDNEANYGEFPWMVVVLQRKEVKGVFEKVMECGGSIIHPQVVLTAAHCVKGKQDILIRAGEWDARTENELYPIQERKVTEVIIHEKYYAGALFNDIALLVLESPLESSPSVNSICLPEQDEGTDNRHCLSSGWGKDNFGEKDQLQTILKRMDFDTVPRETCQEELRKTRLSSKFKVHPTFICVGGKNGSENCKGDGGGPLVCPSKHDPNIYIQAGMLSWGLSCADGSPTIYVNLPLYRNWIDEKLQRITDTSPTSKH